MIGEKALVGKEALETCDMLSIEHEGIMLDVSEIDQDSTLTLCHDFQTTTGAGVGVSLCAYLLLDSVVRYMSHQVLFDQAMHHVDFVFDGPIAAGRYGEQIMFWNGCKWERSNWHAADTWPAERVIGQ